MEGCIVEVVAHRDHVQYIITTPSEAANKAVSNRHEGIAGPGNNAVLQHPSRSAPSHAFEPLEPNA